MPLAKALKTERTHEENQERAYIAASRRSDRSLEARVESARRASEIHKRRTGRSLRVTEQDVVNEEMYEEEDDDLPMQYRRLTAHLQTGSADFNRRLSAYLTNHVAMRSALDQAISNSYAQQFPNAPRFSHNQNVYPSPFEHHVPQPQSPHSAGQPYPTPGTPGYRPGYQQRKVSQSQSQAGPGVSPHMSTPSSAPGMGLPMQRHASHSSHSASHSPVQQRTSVPQTPRSYDGSLDAQLGPTHAPSQASPRQPSQPSQPFQNANNFPNISPFSLSLPVESQMLLNGALDPNDPMTSALMGGSDPMARPFNQRSEPHLKQEGFDQQFGGMSTTLAPSALDMHSRQTDLGQPSSVKLMQAVPGSQQMLDHSDISKLHNVPSTQNSQGSGTVTPGLDSWESFINDSSWNESGT